MTLKINGLRINARYRVLRDWAMDLYGEIMEEQKKEAEIKKWLSNHNKKSLAEQVVNSQIALKREKGIADHEKKQSIGLKYIADTTSKQLVEKNDKINHLQEKCKKAGKLMATASKQIQNLELELKGISEDNRALLKELDYERSEKNKYRKELDYGKGFREGRRIGNGIGIFNPLGKSIPF
jgi:chromosome segregation ATPase